MVREPARVWNATHAEYHGDTSRISHSSKELFLQSRALYFQHIVLESTLRPQTRDMFLGTLLHMLVLEPDLFWQTYYQIPQSLSKNTKYNKQAKIELANENAGRLPVKEQDVTKVMLWHDALFANREIRKLLEMEGPVEQSVIWTDEETGLPLKCRRDKVVPELHVILDIKTCQHASPAAFANACLKFGYHRCADWYMQGEHALTGEPPRYLFAAVSKATGQAALHELGQRSTDLGYQQNREVLLELARCYDPQQNTAETPLWKDNWELQANLIELPERAFNEDLYKLQDELDPELLEDSETDDE